MTTEVTTETEVVMIEAVMIEAAMIEVVTIEGVVVVVTQGVATVVGGMEAGMSGESHSLLDLSDPHRFRVQ